VNILLATSEAVPFAKTGGLADVCGALPVELTRLGHQAAVILPAYRQTRYCGQRDLASWETPSARTCVVGGNRRHRPFHRKCPVLARGRCRRRTLYCNA